MRWAYGFIVYHICVGLMVYRTLCALYSTCKYVTPPIKPIVPYRVNTFTSLIACIILLLTSLHLGKMVVHELICLKGIP